MQNLNVLRKNAPMILTILYINTVEIGENIRLYLYGFNPLRIATAYGFGFGFGNALAGIN